MNLINVISDEIKKAFSTGFLPLDLVVRVSEDSIIIGNSTTITVNSNKIKVSTTDDLSPESGSVGAKILQIVSEIKGTH